MNSTITLINGTKITPERNFKLPDMSYVENSGVNGKQEITKFMYIKHSLNLTIKVDITQYHLEYIFANDVNYIIITNDFTNQAGTLPKKVGYFVVKKRWVAQETIEYTLLCDVVNSFNDSVEISDKTRILRQHKDRWKREVVYGKAHIGDITTQETSWLSERNDELMLYHDYGRLAIISTAIMNIAENISTIYDYDFGYQEMQNAHFYFLDDEYKVISEIPHTQESSGNENQGVIQVSIALNGGFVKDLLAVSPTEIPFPSNAHYIALSFEAYEMAQGSHWYYFQIHDFEDVPEEDWDDAWEALTTHLDSFLQTGNYYDETQGSNKIIPIIDRYSENISPMLYGTDNYYLTEKDMLNSSSWYLVYKNQNNPDDSLVNPVSCFVYASRSINVEFEQGGTETFNANDIWNILARINGFSSKSELVFYVVENWINRGASIGLLGIIICGNNTDNENCEVDVITPEINETYTINTTTGDSQFIRNMHITCQYDSTRNDAAIEITIWQDNGSRVMRTFLGNTDTFTLTFRNGRTARACPNSHFKNQSEWLLGQPTISMFTGSQGSFVCSSITSVNRTDPKLIKIIKLPYCPIDATLSEDGTYLRVSSRWTYDSTEHTLKLARLNTKLTRLLDIDLPLTPWSNAFYEYDHSLVVQADREKSYEFETKLFHSDYYLPKIIYDSFVFTFQLELMTERPADKWTIQYNVSNTITSRFMFTFLDYVCYKNESRDYNNIMYIARNNDCVIFNQQYINYIRTGFNYDMKSLELFREKQNIDIGLGLGKNALTTITSGISGYMSGNYMGVASGILNLGINTAQSLFDRHYAELERQMQIDAKKTQLQNQSTGVIDANDVDLLEVYSQNKLALKLYEVSPRVKKALFNLFYYCGYICEEQGIPDTTSRLRFNYVQAEIVFVKTPNLPQEMIDHLKELYKLGITFLHAYNGQIDYDQKYENWEVSILDN